MMGKNVFESHSHMQFSSELTFVKCALFGMMTQSELVFSYITYITVGNCMGDQIDNKGEMCCM